MQGNRLDGCPSTWFLTQLIYLHFTDDDFGGDDVSRDVSRCFQKDYQGIKGLKKNVTKRIARG